MVKLRLGTRGSALALARSEMVAEQLRAAGHEVEVVRVATARIDKIENYLIRGGKNPDEPYDGGSQ